MRIGIRSRFVLFTLSLLLVSALVFDGYMVSALGARLGEQALLDLKVRGALVAARARAAGDLDAEAPRLATELAALADARVTIINPDGVVRGDSSVSETELARLESHATRPEVIEARERGIGTSERFSATLYGRMLYVAHRLDRADGPWVVRLAHEPLSIEAMIDEMRTRLIYGTLLGLGVAGILSLFSARVFARSLQHLTETARTMRRDLSKRTHLRGDDDIARLGAELDALAAELERSISDLSHQRERLEAMLEAMQEGVMVLRENGAIAVANRALRRMLLAGDVIGKQPIEVVRNAELHEILRESARTRKPVTRELAFGSIRRRRVRVQVSPLAGAGLTGRGGLVAVFSDVTELRRLETLRRDFVANVSHELRTPIASIRATSETLREGALGDPEMAKEFVEIIDRNAQRLHRLVEDLLDLSKIEAKELDLKIRSLDAREEAQAVVDLVRHSAEKRNTRVVVEAPEGLSVKADARALEQILTNLVDNAIKYGPPGSRVTVRARPSPPDRVMFEVSDEGPGIDAAHLPRLFERFYRVDTGRSRALGGTGLGLAIVKHLAEALGGEVSVESALGRGSSFRVELPSSSEQRQH